MTGFVKQTLRDLFKETPNVNPETLPAIPITGVSSDSRTIQPGNIFVAVSGGKTEGHRYIQAAIDQGAAAVVGVEDVPNLGVPYVQVEDARAALARLSAAFYRFPARRLTVIGVTGTDGKTTTSNLIYQILLAAGLRSGIISTVNATIGTEIVDTGFHVTTPEAPDIQRYLSRMVTAGLSHVVLETTSHGLAQERVLGCEFDVGVVTNITHEHLDYHGSFAGYMAAKAKLFTSLSETAAKPHGNPRIAVLNHDDASYEFLAEKTTVKQISYSLHPGATVWAEDLRMSASGSQFTVRGPGFSFQVQTSLIGEYNVSNCLAAIAATVAALDLPPEAAAHGISGLNGVPGRWELIKMGQRFTAIVDFAHTPNALECLLQTARRMTNGRVIAVFGSAGLRDKEKRRMMAEISARLADLTILTAEDPRTEALDEILADMAEGAKAGGGIEQQTFWRIAERGNAIRFAVHQARPGDLVVACGKGHEQSMCFGEIEYSWDDRTAMRAALAELQGISGPLMPYLPTQKNP